MPGDIEGQSKPYQNNNDLLLQNESAILGEVVNVSNHLRQDPDEDTEKIYQRDNAILYDVPANPSELASLNSIDSNEVGSIQSFKGRENQDSRSKNSSIKRTTSKESSLSLQKFETRYFSPRLAKQRRNVVLRFAMTVLTFAAFFFTIFALFWGSNAYTVKYYRKVKILGVIQDDILGEEMVSVTPLTTILSDMIAQTPGKWSLYNTTSFSQKFNLSGTQEINDKVTERIYHEAYWMSINVKPNATAKLYNSIADPTAPPFNASDIFEVMYESGRDPSNLRIAILPIIETLEENFAEYYTYTYLPSLLSNITRVNPNITFNYQNLATMGNINFGYIDYRPFYRRGLISPVQIGIIYGLVITVFQYLIYTPLHMEMAKYLTANNYIIYRIVISWVTFFFTSLFYCTVSAMFGFDFTKAFGRAGFVVYWMTSWLYMVACGGANENMISLIFLWKPQFLGFWILSFVILNIGPSFFPMVLNNAVYRYGYIMPIHNALDIFRVIFMDISKRHMGRNYGVLVAWIALNTAILPFVIKFVTKTNRKRQAAAAAAAANK